MIVFDLYDIKCNISFTFCVLYYVFYNIFLCFFDIVNYTKIRNERNDTWFIVLQFRKML